MKQNKIADDATIKAIFCNIQEIHEIHKKTIKEMEHTPHLLGAIFAKSVCLSSKIIMYNYSSYCIDSLIQCVFLICC